MYETLLDVLLTPANAKETLIKTQTLEKKWQLVQLHKSSLGDKAFTKSNEFSAKGKQLLNAIATVGIPEVQQMLELKSMLKTANKQWMEAFLEADGITILVEKMSVRVARVPLSELDAALLYEMILCCKAIMNNSTGMDRMLDAPGCIDIVARCLVFDWKALALEALEILSVCCYYSPEGTALTISGLRHMSRSLQEAPFFSLVKAIGDQDVEVRSAILLLFNYMVSGVDDTQRRVLMRKELEAVGFSGICQNAIDSARKDIEDMATEKATVSRASTASRESNSASFVNPAARRGGNRRGSIAMIGKKKFMEQQRAVGGVDGGEEEVPKQFAEDGETAIDPSKGLMSGLCTAAKNRGTNTMKMADMFGGKRIKHRWYDLSTDGFQWWEFSTPYDNKVPSSKRAANRFVKGSVPSAKIVDFKPVSSDPIVVKECIHSFDIVTEDRIFSLGCTSALEKESWLTALQSIRDMSSMKRSAYKMVTKELGQDEVVNYAQQFSNQFAVFENLMADDRCAKIAYSGVDTTDVFMMSKMLSLELTASGLSSKLVALMQELLVFPSESRTAEKQWDMLLAGCRRLRTVEAQNTADAGAAGKSTAPLWGFGEESLVELLKIKEDISTTGGSYYKEITKVLRLLGEKDAELQTVKEKSELAANLPSAGAAITVEVPIEVRVEVPVEVKVPVPNEVYLQQLQEKEIQIQKLMADLSSAKQAQAQAPPPMPNIPPPIPSMPPTIPQALPPPVQAAPMAMPPVPAFTMPSPVTAAPVAAPAAAGGAPDPRYEKYTKMKKMLPEGAVRQKMMGDGFSQAEIDGFFSGAAAPAGPAAGGGGGLPMGGLPKPNPLAGIGARAAGGLPKPAAPAAPVAVVPAGMKEKPKVAPAVKMKGLFWTKLKPEEIDNTIWKTAGNEDVAFSASEMKFLEDQFSSAPAKTMTADPSAAAAAAKPKAISYLDGKRVQQVLITLGKLRKTPKEIKEMVRLMDPKVLTMEQTVTCMNIVPTAEELGSITSHDDPESLDKGDKLFLELSDVPRFEQRLKCHEIAFRWGDDADAAASQLTIIVSAIKELTNPKVSLP